MARFIFSTLFLIVVLGITSSKADSPKSRPRRLVNGTVTSIQNYPFVVSLQYNGSHICGGTILRRDIILTAASCVDRRWHKKLSVRVGSSECTSGGKEYRVEKVAYHQDYHPIRQINDVALLKLSEHIDFEFTGTRQVKLVAAYEKIKLGTLVTAVGWGSTKRSRTDFSESIRSIELELIGMKDCIKYYGGSDGLVGQICTRSPAKSACFGDAGGPLLIHSRQVGIASKAIGCTKLRLPDTYTEISHLHDWISSEISSLRDSDRPPIVLYPLTLEELTYSRELQGLPIRIEKAAFVVSILKETDNHLWCVGTIIGPKHVLTTGQCANVPLEALKVRSGSNELTQGGQEHRIVESSWYPNDASGNSSRYENNIGIMVVDPPFFFDDTTEKARGFIEDDEISPDTAAKVYGWDVMKDNLRKAENMTAMNLQSLDVIVKPNDECNGLLSASSLPGLAAKQICAMGRFGLCVGPSGAPLMANGGQVGIFVRGNAECADYRNPGIFVEIAPYRNWINQVLAKSMESTSTNE